MAGKHNILLIWDRIGDYHRARWRALQQLNGTENVFGADLGGADKLYKWQSTGNSPQYYLFSEKPVEQKDRKTRFDNFKKCVRENNITAICLGYGRLEYLQFIFWAWKRGIHVLVFCESWYPRNAILDTIKGKGLSLFANTFFVSGKRAFDHFTKRYGIHPSRIKTGYSVVDNEHFTRKEEAPPKENVLLCVARYSEEKNLSFLIKSFIASELSERWTLRIVGDGPQKEVLKDQAKGHSNIELTNWVTYDQIPQLFYKARLFILPSTFEPWGLVVNEAMTASLPVLVSYAVGAAPDLVGDDNGAVFDEENETQLVNILNNYNNKSQEELDEQGHRSLEKIKQFTPETWASSIMSLLEQKQPKG